LYNKKLKKIIWDESLGRNFVCSTACKQRKTAVELYYIKKNLIKSIRNEDISDSQENKEIQGLFTVYMR